MSTELIDEFESERECEYKGERYRVRDNGAVYRVARNGEKQRPLDEKWTFGRPNRTTGYMTLASITVHRVVATAFHGEQPSQQHIVDHIDTNRRNNRAENLRWITRLENIILNPITRQRITLAYGSLDAFFEDPSSPRQSKLAIDFGWMKTVSKEEAATSRDRLLSWAESGQIPSGSGLGDWVYGPKEPEQEPVEEDIIVESLTPNAFQRKWKTPSEFPGCPNEFGDEPLFEYEQNLRFGDVYASNQFGDSHVVIAQTSYEEEALGVLSNNDMPIRGWHVTKITIEDGRFCHENVGSFDTLPSALMQFYNVIGRDFGEAILDG